MSATTIQRGPTTEHTKRLQDVVSPNSLDQVLSDELLKLSLRDRCAMYEEIHGVSTLATSIKAESPELLQSSLEGLSRELRAISDTSPLKAAYLESQVIPDTYINTASFRLKFLRHEGFDPKKAAVRLLKFLNFALHLFGPIVLERPMRMADFTTREKKWMQAGTTQILPYRDQSGRLIIAWVDDFGMEVGTLVGRWKYLFYFLYCLSDDIETQQRGYVNVIFIGGKNPPLPGLKDFEYSQKLNDASPVRKCSAHWCMPPNLPLTHPLHFIRAGYTLSLDQERSRVKFHIGEQVELLYELRTFGIPIEFIPITGTGNVKTTYHKQWMKSQKRFEDERTRSPSTELSIIVMPRSKDVVFKGGKWLNCHPGNAMFDSMLEAKLEEHIFGSQKEKIAITKAIIQDVHEQGGRFLQWVDGGWWSELKDASQIHSKVAVKIRRVTGKTIAGGQAFQSSTFLFSNQDNSKRRKLSSNVSASPWVSDSNESEDESCCSCLTECTLSNT